MDKFEGLRGLDRNARKRNIEWQDEMVGQHMYNILRCISEMDKKCK